MKSDTYNLNILHKIKVFAIESPQKTAVSVDREELTYRDLFESIKRFSESFRKTGVKDGDRVGLILPNGTLWYRLFWALVNIGAQPVPLDPQIGEWELKQILDITAINICCCAVKYRANKIEQHIRSIHENGRYFKKIIFQEDCPEDDVFISIDSFLNLCTGIPGDEIYETEYEDTLMLATTSGTTGNPKIITVEHGGFHKAMADMAQYLGFTKEDHMLLGMPLYHQGGFGMGLQMVVSGGTVHYQTRFDPQDFLRTIQEKKITIIQLTSTLAKIILTVPDFSSFDISSVKMAYFAGEVLPDEIAEMFYKKLNIRVINIIGSSETGTMVIWDSSHDRGVDVNSFRPLPFTKMRIVNDTGNEVQIGETGIIHIFTDAVLKEYFGNISETNAKIRYEENGRWFNTGDLGIKLGDGRVKFAGRVKRIIKRGANLVYPEEVESFLLTHPLVNAVAVISEKQDIFGELIVAYVQPVTGSLVSRGDLLKYCRGQLSSYKTPDKFLIVDSIPKDIGKVQFKYLKTQTTEQS